MNAYSLLLRETIDRHGLFDIPESELDQVCLAIAKKARAAPERQVLLAKDDALIQRRERAKAEHDRNAAAQQVVTLRERLQDKQRELDEERRKRQLVEGQLAVVKSELKASRRS